MRPIIPFLCLGVGSILPWLGGFSLGEDPARNIEENRLTKDVYGDPLPQGALLRLGSIRFRQPEILTCVAFSPGGKLVATGDHQKTIRLWDYPSGKSVAKWRAHKSIITSLAFSSDTKELVSAGDGVCLWGVSSQTKIREYASEGEWFTSVAISANDELIGAVSLNGLVRAWVKDTGKELLQFQGHKQQLHNLAFSNDGSILASGGKEGTIFLWSTETRKEAGVLEGHQIPVGPVDFSPNGKLLASADYMPLDANPFGRQPQQEATIRIWDVKSRKELLCIKPHAPGTLALKFAKDSKTIASISGDWLTFWDVTTGRELRKSPAPAGAGYGYSQLALSPDGKALLIMDGSLWFWDFSKHEILDTFSGHCKAVTSLGFSIDASKVYSAGPDLTFRIWETGRGHQLNSTKAGESSLFPMAVSFDGKEMAASGSNEPDLYVCDTTTGREEYRLKMEPRDYPTRSAFSRDGRLLAVGHQWAGVSVWDLTTRKQVWIVKGAKGSRGDGPHQCLLAFSPDGRILASTDPTEASRLATKIVLWDAVRGTVLHRLSSQYINSFTFSPDGKMLCCANGMDAIDLWEVETGQLRIRRHAGGTYANLVAFSPDGRTIASTHKEANSLRTGNPDDVRRMIWLWDIFAHPRLAEFEGHQGDITTLAFSPDAKTLATGSADTTILLWDVQRILSGNGAYHPQKGNWIQRRFDSETETEVLSALWNDLPADEVATTPESGSTSFRALSSLVHKGNKAVPFLKERINRVKPVDLKKLQQCIENLDNKDFQTRTLATQEIRKLGEFAEPGLVKALGSNPPLETRRRLEELIDDIRKPVTSPEKLQTLRAIEILEHIRTPEAKELLKTLASGAPEARITREAKASLDRLAKLNATTP